MNSDKIKDFLMGIFFFVFSLLLVYLLTLPKRQALMAQESAAPQQTAEPKQTSLIIEEPAAKTDISISGKELPPLPDIDINSWEFMYAGIKQSVGFSYHPEVCNFEDQYLDVRIYDQTKAFFDAARDAGYGVWIGVSYRNSDYTMYNYEKAIEKYGSSYEAAKHVAPPGCSEHCTGLAFDVTDDFNLAANYYNMHDEDMADSEAYKWMAENCADYGFIVRYPEGKEEFYEQGCYVGHFRYVGVEAAKYIMENDLCLEEFIELYK